jgi:predicted amidohydrolase
MAPVKLPTEMAQPINSDVHIPVMVHVTAPADLPAGYTFEASLNGDPDRTFTAEVVRIGTEQAVTKHCT